MKHFVGYHNFERMEQEAADEVSDAEENVSEEDEEVEDEEADVEEFPYGFLTRKKPDRFLGNVIWGIQGQGKPREYWLYGWFIVEKAVNIQGERFAAHLRGTEGIHFPDEFYLNDEPWFREFFTANSHFSLGLQEIAPRFLDEICKLVKRAGLPLPRDCDERYPDVQSCAEGEHPTHGQQPAASTVGASSASEPDTEIEQSAPGRRFVTEERIIRDTAITLEVKQLHDFCCQVCGMRMNTPDGPFAEGAHSPTGNSPLRTGYT